MSRAASLSLTFTIRIKKTRKYLKANWIQLILGCRIANSVLTGISTLLQRFFVLEETIDTVANGFNFFNSHYHPIHVLTNSQAAAQICNLHTTCYKKACTIIDAQDNWCYAVEWILLWKIHQVKRGIFTDRLLTATDWPQNARFHTGWRLRNIQRAVFPDPTQADWSLRGWVPHFHNKIMRP